MSGARGAERGVRWENKAAAFAEIRRVLRPGGTFFFNTWDRLANNELAETVDEAPESILPASDLDGTRAF